MAYSVMCCSWTGIELSALNELRDTVVCHHIHIKVENFDNNAIELVQIFFKFSNELTRFYAHMKITDVKSRIRIGQR
ncbi:hypothetical protein BpHYR1_011774 [Brachionus plicatilis]|uniref:Uncharacterized protein n=1 Tax=Brachionus plicatilis TaxID=10195 RepID=A0A3M7Q526_BRAPC|nr:hypothetical protein BpHYR1_011774 [Brachionus plicatilis]